MAQINFGSTFAFAGCWHADVLAAQRAVEYLAKKGAKTIIHTGDFAYANKGTNGHAEKFLNRLNTALVKADMYLIAIRGNHDDPGMYRTYTERTPQGLSHPFTVMRERVLHAPDGTVWEHNGVRFLFMGGAFSVDRAFRTLGVSFWADEVTSVDAIDAALKTDAQAIDIMVTHDVPAGVNMAFIDRSSTSPGWDIHSAEAHRIPLGDVMKHVLKEGGYSIAGHMHNRQDIAFRVSPDMRVINSVILDRGDLPGPIDSSLLLLGIADGQVTNANPPTAPVWTWG